MRIDRIQFEERFLSHHRGITDDDVEIMNTLVRILLGSSEGRLFIANAMTAKICASIKYPVVTDFEGMEYEEKEILGWSVPMRPEAGDIWDFMERGSFVSMSNAIHEMVEDTNDFLEKMRPSVCKIYIYVCDDLEMFSWNVNIFFSV